MYTHQVFQLHASSWLTCCPAWSTIMLQSWSQPHPQQQHGPSAPTSAPSWPAILLVSPPISPLHPNFTIQSVCLHLMSTHSDPIQADNIWHPSPLLLLTDNFPLQLSHLSLEPLFNLCPDIMTPLHPYCQPPQYTSVYPLSYWFTLITQTGYLNRLYCTSILCPVHTIEDVHLYPPCIFCPSTPCH